MISILRDFTKSWIFTLLMALLIVSFAVFGLRDVFSQVGDNIVVAAGKRRVTDQQFKTQYDQFKQNYVQQGGKAFTNDEFVDQGQDVAMLDMMAKNETFSAWLDQIGVKPSARMVVDEIAKTPYFFNQVTGKFDKDYYRQLLAQQRIDEHSYEQQVADQLAAQQYMEAAIGGLKAPRIYAATQAALMQQTRDASFFLLSPANVVNPPVPTETEIEAYYKEKAAQLSQPEIRQASVVEFSPAIAAQTVTVDEDALKKAYQFKLDSLSTPETRTFNEVTAPDAAAAARISAALKAGQDPDAVAKANKGEVIRYNLKPRTAVPDAKIGDAAFSMHTGDVSGPITGDLGIAVIVMGDIKIGSIPTFAAVHDQLKQQYIQEKAADKVNELVNAFQKAHDAGEDFTATAQKLGLTVQPLNPMTADGKTSAVDPKTGQPMDYSKLPVLVKDVFDLSAGGTSDVEELGNGEYIAIRLDAVKPAGLVPLDDKLKPMLAQNWRAEKMASAIQAAGDAAMARLNKGEAFEKVAADLKAPIQHVPNIDRQNGAKAVGQEILGHVFSIDPGRTFEAPVDNFRLAIGRLDAIHQGDPAVANAAASTVRNQMAQSIAHDIDDLTHNGATATIKARTFPSVADRVLDVTPKKGADASAAKGDKVKS